MGWFLLQNLERGLLLVVLGVLLQQVYAPLVVTLPHVGLLVLVLAPLASCSYRAGADSRRRGGRRRARPDHPGAGSGRDRRGCDGAVTGWPVTSSTGWCSARRAGSARCCRWPSRGWPSRPSCDGRPNRRRPSRGGRPLRGRPAARCSGGGSAEGSGHRPPALRLRWSVERSSQRASWWPRSRCSTVLGARASAGCSRRSWRPGAWRSPRTPPTSWCSHWSACSAAAPTTTRGGSSVRDDGRGAGLVLGAGAPVGHRPPGVGRPPPSTDAAARGATRPEPSGLSAGTGSSLRVSGRSAACP